MDLNILWFILISVLFVGFFFLEGFDYGVGILLPFMGKNDSERRIVINTIGPVWDGNEVWLITAGGAIFAAFPNWYATLFSGFYLALFFILVALIIRGVAFEFRSSDRSPRWRSTWDVGIFVGSLLNAILWGVAVTNLLKGVPINGEMQYVGTFFDLLSPYTLIGGLTTLLLFTLHGALYLTLKTEGGMVQRAWGIAKTVSGAALVVLVILAVMTYFQTDLYASLGATLGIVICAVAMILTVMFTYQKKSGKAFITSGVTIASLVISVFLGLFPRVMVSNLNPEWSLNIYNASSSPYTLKIMTIVALTTVPIVIAYQAWSYWIFRKRVTAKNIHY
ncbi:cytochrome d oxidase cyd, subunit II [Desulfitobacterium dichloroeliminans LMG P-21439]|uniref:Cytochrome d oxidase cyd, subunit II n=1 Tax=Desulfitobacterium dichloroeliminans (strain LMG P-21439 / DCA1) TaxID=871963 RepID=L0F7D9_DESDL|nr:cytochrome d ubiquinol oxidase subunit II [Desulfitobacterium dichloroeliminans]AGA68551.1 cytochrome d oxidase cyd, subunit II [Desulfitobacterium dichloroeliminans LMG P-21439]